MNYFLIYIIALVLFLIIDAIWLGVISKNLYKKEIGHLMSEKPNFIAALIFYLFFIVGLVYFVIAPAVSSGDINTLIVSGALFGFMTYATYDLTNLATLKKWPLKITFIDLLWGMFISISVSYLTVIIYNLI